VDDRSRHRHPAELHRRPRAGDVIGSDHGPHDLPKQTAVLLCLVGGFLALRELQTDIDASAAVGGIVASAGG
jgi:hypothetical protein